MVICCFGVVRWLVVALFLGFGRLGFVVLCSLLFDGLSLFDLYDIT